MLAGQEVQTFSANEHWLLKVTVHTGKSDVIFLLLSSPLSGKDTPSDPRAKLMCDLLTLTPPTVDNSSSAALTSSASHQKCGNIMFVTLNVSLSKP